MDDDRPDLLIDPVGAGPRSGTRDGDGTISRPDDPLLVATSAGLVRGVARRGARYWRSVPYAAAPVGDLRWRAPGPPRPWQGVREASARGPVPWQQGGHSFGPLADGLRCDEDCLTVDVCAPGEGLRRREARWAPRPGSADGAVHQLLPVMVFVHGGSLTNGSANLSMYDPHDLVARGVVVVSVGYRLGALGFVDLTGLSTPERPFASNLGLRDLLAALAWVRDEITGFGGDPDDVTVFGESAGGTLIECLLAMPQAAGLFDRAIMQSPACNIAFEPELTRSFTARFLELLGLADDEDPVPALLATAPQRLVDAAEALALEVRTRLPGIMTPALVIGDDLLPEHPRDTILAGRGHRKPLIIGTNAREGAIFDTDHAIVPTRAAELDLMFALFDPEARERVVAAYPGYPARAQAIEMGADASFFWPTSRVAAGHATVTPTWVYRYDFATWPLRVVGWGATHAMELLALFHHDRHRLARVAAGLTDEPALRRVAARLQDRWTAFARTGRPDEQWPTYSPTERRTLIMDRRDRVESDPRGEVRRAWEGA